MFDITKTKAVLWDLDDTLYSRVDAARQTFPGMFKENLYIDRSDAFIDKAVDFMMTQVGRNSMIHKDAFNALLEKYPPDKPYVRSECLDYYYAHISDFAKPYPEEIKVIKKLKELGIKSAIVTNVSEDRVYSQKQKVSALGIEHLFDVIVYSGELGIHKPDRRIFDHTTSLLNVLNDQCVYVGDNPESDVLGALNAGMEVVWLDKWNCEENFDDNPRVHCVKSVSEYFVI